jgi:hypothetical protein
MPSPFPGMDPWLEDRSVFPDLHESLVFLIKKSLNAQLPAGYYATTKMIVWVADDQRRDADVSVFADRARGGVAVAPLTGYVDLGDELDFAEEGYVEVRHKDGDRLVTAVEVLSPANKADGAGRHAYLDKQRELIRGGVHLLEIDLLRGGRHTSAIPPARLGRLAAVRFPYHVALTWQGRPHGVAIRLADRLPAVAVPLDPGVGPVTVELQGALAEAYEAGSYARRVDYAQPCTPPLSPEEQAWADGVLSKRPANSTES